MALVIKTRCYATYSLTADVQGETKQQALNTGMDDVLTKPFQGNELIEKIFELIQPSKGLVTCRDLSIFNVLIL